MALKSYERTPHYRQIQSAFKKILHFLPETMPLGAARDIYRFDETPAPSAIDAEKLLTLEHAALHRQTVRLTYLAHYNRETIERKFDPYHIAVVEGHWYAVGHCHLRSDVRVFALSRMLTLAATDERFEIKKDFILENYFAEGFVRGGRTYQVELGFSEREAVWIEGRQWHKSQHLSRLKDGSLLMQITVPNLYRIKRWVMNFGAAAEVLKPKVLREMIAQESTAVTAMYART
ncbi:MAG: WYL domain-containing protein [Rhizobacter sp.]|nr:WYL domain-containing protein [Chlorobiales bacterium]